MKLTALSNSMVRLVIIAISLTMIGLLQNAVHAQSEQLQLHTKNYAKAFSITHEEASTRIKWQDGSDKLNAHLKEKYSSNFGGMWIEDNGRVKIGVFRDQTNKSGFKEEAKNYAESLGIDNGVDFENTEHSIAQLERERLSLLDNISTNTALKNKQYYTGIKTDKNYLILVFNGLEDADKEEAKKLLKNKDDDKPSSVQLEFTSENLALAGCNNLHCSPELRGGVGIANTASNYQSANCTLGFIVVGNSGQEYSLTAGHCNDGNPQNGWATRNTSGSLKKIGPYHPGSYRYYSGGMDIMMIKIRNSYNWTNAPWVYLRGGGVTIANGASFAPPTYNESYQITGHSTSGGLVGERVCTSGIGHSASCGPVELENVTANLDGKEVHGLVRARLCITFGDSGGPVIYMGKALGIIHGGDTVNTCGTTFYTGISPIIREYNYTIHVKIN